MIDFKTFILESSLSARCTLCGEELTRPIYYKQKPYGYSCIRKVIPEGEKLPGEYVCIGSLHEMIGKRKAIQITRDWDDPAIQQSLSDEGKKAKAGQLTVNFIYRLKTQKGLASGTSEFAIKDDKDMIWIPKSELKSTLSNKKSVNVKLSPEDVKKEIDLA